MEQRTGSKLGKEIHQGCILLPCSFNLYVEYITVKCLAGWSTDWNQDSHKKYRYTDDTTLRAESKEELRNLLLNMKEESEKVGLKLNIQKTKIMTSGPTIHGK